jgi:hypothetical protein
VPIKCVQSGPRHAAFQRTPAQGARDAAFLISAVALSQLSAAIRRSGVRARAGETGALEAAAPSRSMLPGTSWDHPQS